MPPPPAGVTRHASAKSEGKHLISPSSRRLLAGDLQADVHRGRDAVGLDRHQPPFLGERHAPLVKHTRPVSPGMTKALSRQGWQDRLDDPFA